MRKLKIILFLGASLIMVVGCTSKKMPCAIANQKPAAPPAWAMMPPSNSLPVAGRNVLGIRDGAGLRRRPNSTENASGIHQDAMPSMIAIILLIILHIWLCRQGGNHFWSESRLNISLLMLDIEHLARGKGLR